MQQIGKPIADARDEAALGARVFEYYAGAIGKFCGQTIPVAKGGFDFTLRQPMEWSPALCRGISFSHCVLESGPGFSGWELCDFETSVDLAVDGAEAGRDCTCGWVAGGVLQVLPASGAGLGEALVTHPLVRKISFTGSTRWTADHGIGFTRSEANLVGARRQISEHCFPRRIRIGGKQRRRRR